MDCPDEPAYGSKTIDSPSNQEEVVDFSDIISVGCCTLQMTFPRKPQCSCCSLQRDTFSWILHDILVQM